VASNEIFGCFVFFAITGIGECAYLLRKDSDAEEGEQGYGFFHFS
jgi:hypothetical protein